MTFGPLKFSLELNLNVSQNLNSRKNGCRVLTDTMTVWHNLEKKAHLILLGMRQMQSYRALHIFYHGKYLIADKVNSMRRWLSTNWWRIWDSNHRDDLILSFFFNFIFLNVKSFIQHTETMQIWSNFNSHLVEIITNSEPF